MSSEDSKKIKLTGVSTTGHVGALHVDIATTTVISSSCNTAFEAITSELSKRLSKVADAASDSEESK